MSAEASTSQATDIAATASEPLNDLPRTITLTTIDEAPKELKLRYSKCLPCLDVGSRCDGHDNYTRACVQCGKRQVDCTWELEKFARINYQRRVARKRTKREQSVLDGTDAAATTSAGPSDAESTISFDARRSKPKAARRERQKQHVIPPAGWPSLRTATQSSSKQDVKGKRRATSVDSKSDRKRARSQTAASDEEINSDATPADEVLARMKRYQHGRNFLTIKDYKSILASQYAEDSTDLARHLHWWEFSPQAAAIKERWKHVYFMSAEEAAKLPYLDLLQAENAHSWTLWPRLSHLHPLPADSGSSTLLQPALDLADALRDAALRSLQRSGAIQKALDEMTDIHLDAYMEEAYEYGVQESARSSAQAPNPLLTRDEFRKRYLDHDELLLDHAEAKEEYIVPIVTHALDAILLRLAELRKPLRSRREANWHPSHKALNEQIDKQFSSIQELASDPPPLDSVEDQAHSTADVNNEVVLEPAPTPQTAEDAAPDPDRKRGPRIKADHQIPADWKAVLLAAMTVSGISRE